MEDDSFQIVRLTGPGRGAVATVALEGAGAARAVAACFGISPDRLAAVLPVDAPRLRRLFDAKDDTEEDLVVVRLSADRFRLHGHGGEVAVDRTVCLLEEQGGRSIDADRWIEAEHDGTTRGEARRLLAHAPTLKTARILLDQFHGRLDEAFARIDRDIAAEDFEAARQQIDRLLALAPLGIHLTRPWRGVIAGPPNAGKSSLINAMLGYRRAIVNQTAGTTRDAVEAETAVDGWPITLIDTAGLRETADPLESAGVERTDASLQSADLRLLVFDSSLPIGDAELELIEQHPDAIQVWNKSDLPADRDVLKDRPGPVVSAQTGDGIDGLFEEIARRLVPEDPPPGTAVPFTDRQVEWLMQRNRQLSE